MELIDKWMQFTDNFESIFTEIFGKKVQIRVIDREFTIRHIVDLDSGINANFYVGMKLPAKSGPEMAMTEKKIIRRLVDKSHYGVELRTLNIPFEDGSGCISLTYNIELQYLVSNSLENVVAAAQQITASSQEISENSSSMGGQFQEMMNQINNAFEYSYAMKDIAAVVKGINDHLKLITINALIEAAHAGEHGRGFAVVAQEVRKLTESTQEQISQVNESVNLMLKNIETATSYVEHIQAQIEHQSRSSEEIYHAISSVTNSITQLEETIEELLNIK